MAHNIVSLKVVTITYSGSWLDGFIAQESTLTDWIFMLWQACMVHRHSLATKQQWYYTFPGCQATQMVLHERLGSQWQFLGFIRPHWPGPQKTQQQTPKHAKWMDQFYDLEWFWLGFGEVILLGMSKNLWICSLLSKIACLVVINPSFSSTQDGTKHCSQPNTVGGVGFDDFQPLGDIFSNIDFWPASSLSLISLWGCHFGHTHF